MTKSKMTAYNCQVTKSLEQRRAQQKTNQEKPMA